MGYRVTIEHRPSQGLYRSFVPLGNGRLADYLQGRLGAAATVLAAEDHADPGQPVVVEYDLGGEGRFASHDQAVDLTVAVMQEAGLHALRVVVSEVVRHYVAGALVGGATALGITKDANPWVTTVATVAAAGLGALAGGQVEQVVARFEAQRHPYGAWTWYRYQTGVASWLSSSATRA